MDNETESEQELSQIRCVTDGDRIISLQRLYLVGRREGPDRIAFANEWRTLPCVNILGEPMPDLGLTHAPATPHGQEIENLDREIFRLRTVLINIRRICVKATNQPLNPAYVKDICECALRGAPGCEIP